MPDNIVFCSHQSKWGGVREGGVKEGGVKEGGVREGGVREGELIVASYIHVYVCMSCTLVVSYSILIVEL